MLIFLLISVFWISIRLKDYKISNQIFTYKILHIFQLTFMKLCNKYMCMEKFASRKYNEPKLFFKENDCEFPIYRFYHPTIDTVALLNVEQASPPIVSMNSAIIFHNKRL